EQFPATRVEHISFLRQRKFAGRSMEQAHAQSCFEVCYLPRYRGLRHRQRVGRTYEAAGFDDRGEGLHFLEFVHFVPLFKTINLNGASLSLESGHLKCSCGGGKVLRNTHQPTSIQEST